MTVRKLILLFLMLLCAILFFSCTGKAPIETDGIDTVADSGSETEPATKNPYAPTSGISFDGFPTYLTTIVPTQMPLTFEAWVKYNGESGTSPVFGNMYEMKTNSFCFRVRDGIPTLVLAARAESVAFNKAKVAPGVWTHVAITVDFEGKKFHCYINGELKESRSLIEGHVKAISAIEFNEETDTRWPMVGGIFSRVGNAGNPFCGEIGSFAAYTDMRTAEEVAADYRSMREPDQSDLMMAYVFEKSGQAVYRDLSRNENDLSWMGYGYLTDDELDLPEKYDYSIMVIGDTQGLSQRTQDSGFYDLYDWLEKNIKSKKIEAVIGVGDITDDNIPEQWEKAAKVFSSLEGKVRNFPVLGNHDVSTEYGGDDPELFKKYLIYKEDGNNGSFDGSMKSYFYRFEIQGHKYLFLGMGYPSTQEEVDWAKTVLEAHPDYNVILSCHDYIDSDGTPLQSAGASRIRNQLVLPYSNVVLVVCGHIHSENVLLNTEHRDDGTTVQSLLVDPQEYNYKVNIGVATALYFTNGGRTVHVANHLAGHDVCLGTDSVRTFELDLVHNRAK